MTCSGNRFVTEHIVVLIAQDIDYNVAHICCFHGSSEANSIPLKWPPMVRCTIATKLLLCACLIIVGLVSIPLLCKSSWNSKLVNSDPVSYVTTLGLGPAKLLVIKYFGNIYEFLAVHKV